MASITNVSLQREKIPMLTQTVASNKFTLRKATIYSENELLVLGLATPTFNG